MKGRDFSFLILGLFICSTVLVVTSPFQTWYVNKVLGNSPTIQGTVGFVAAGFGHIKVRNLVIEKAHGKLTFPEVSITCPVFHALIKNEFKVEHLEAKGWTLDLTQGNEDDLSHGKYDSLSLGKAALALSFEGIISQLALPAGLSIKDVVLNGDILLPPAPHSKTNIRIHVLVSGGNMELNKDAAFEFSLLSDSSSPVKVPHDTVHITGSLKARMNTPHSFSHVGLLLNGSARGPKIPQGVELTASLSADQVAQGEHYVVSLMQASKELLHLNADFNYVSARINGVWKFNGSDSDLDPFMLGRLIPAFTLSGSGAFDTDFKFLRTHVSGSLTGEMNHLEYVRPELDVLGECKLKTFFDVTRSDFILRVDRLNVNLDKNSPSVTLTSLQPFAFNSKTGELEVADASQPLLKLNILAAPLNWLNPWLGSYRVTQGELRGDVLLVAGKGGLELNSVNSLKATHVALMHSKHVLFTEAGLDSPFTALYTPQGWQMQLELGTLVILDAPVSFSVKWGRLAGRDQPLKVSSQVEAHTQDWLTFMTTEGILPEIPKETMPAGNVHVSITSSLGKEKTSSFNVKADHLVLAHLSLRLPDISCQLSLTENPESHFSFTAPVESGYGHERKELLVAGDGFYNDDLFHLKAKVSSTSADAALIGLVEALTFRKKDESGPALIPVITPPKYAFWQGVEADIAFNLKDVMLGVIPCSVSGTLNCESGALNLTRVKVSYPKAGELQLEAKLQFEASNLRPYTCVAEIKTRDCNPTYLFSAFNQNQLPSVEGKFDLDAHIIGRGASVDELTQRLHGECNLRSKSGTFGMLSAKFMPKLVQEDKLDQTLALVTSVSQAITGKKLPQDLMNTVNALTAFTKTLSPIKYDQLSVTISRDDTLDTELKDFSLIAPEIRLGATGRIAEVEGISLVNQPLLMDFRLSARGHIAEALRVAGLLNSKKPDDLGYFPCTLPIHISGTLAKPDTSQLKARLEKIALERSGAGELLDRIFGN
jgi:hypothetical protein